MSFTDQVGLILSQKWPNLLNKPLDGVVWRGADYYYMNLHRKVSYWSLIAAAQVRAKTGNTALKFSLVKPTLALFELQRHIIPLLKALKKLVRMSSIAKVLPICSTQKWPNTGQKGQKIWDIHSFDLVVVSKTYHISRN